MSIICLTIYHLIIKIGDEEMKERWCSKLQCDHNLVQVYIISSYHYLHFYIYRATTSHPPSQHHHLIHLSLLLISHLVQIFLFSILNFFSLDDYLLLIPHSWHWSVLWFGHSVLTILIQVLKDILFFQSPHYVIKTFG